MTTKTAKPHDLTPEEIAELGDMMLSHPNERGENYRGPMSWVQRTADPVAPKSQTIKR